MLKMREIRDLFPMAVGAVIDYTNGDIILDLPEDYDYTEDIIYGCSVLGYSMKSCNTTAACGEVVARYVLTRGSSNSKQVRAELIRFYRNEGKELLHR